MEKIFYKNMGIYVLHRSNELDHGNGRPAILLKYRTKISLTWTGTHKLDLKSKEKPLIILMNNKKTYFYASGIEKVATKYLIGHWIDYSNKNKSSEAKAYELLPHEQQQLISKFVSFTLEQDPYLKISKLEKENKQLKKEIELLKNSNLKIYNCK